MQYLHMNDHCILNAKQLREHFSPAEALLNREAFAAMIASQLGSLNSETAFYCNMFCFALLRRKGLLGRMQPDSILYHNFLSDAQKKELPGKLSWLESYCIHANTEPCNLYKNLIHAFCAEESIGIRLQVFHRPLLNTLLDTALNTGLMPEAQTELFFMLVSAYILAGCTPASHPIAAADAEAAFRMQKPRPALIQELERDAWVRIPAEGDLLLPERRLPHRFLLHPAASGPVQEIELGGESKSVRILPDNCMLRTHRIIATAHPFSNSGSSAKLCFYRDEDDPAPLEFELRCGEYLYFNAVHIRDDSAPPMALAPLPVCVQNGACRLRRSDLRSDELRFEHSGRSFHSGVSGAYISSFAPESSGGGMICLRSGVPDASAYRNYSLNASFLELLDLYCEAGTSFVEIALANMQLLLLDSNGNLYASGCKKPRCAQNVLTLSGFIDGREVDLHE